MRVQLCVPADNGPSITRRYAATGSVGSVTHICHHGLTSRMWRRVTDARANVLLTLGRPARVAIVAWSTHARQHTVNSLQANIGRALWHTDKRVARAAHHLSMRSQLWARLGQL